MRYCFNVVNILNQSQSNSGTNYNTGGNVGKQQRLLEYIADICHNGSCQYSDTNTADQIAMIIAS